RVVSSGAFVQRYDLDCRVPDFFEEAIERGALQEDFPPAARALPEDYVGDAFAFGKLDQPVGWAIGLDADNRGAEALCQCDVPLQGLPIGGCDSSGGFPWCFHVDGVPARSQPPGDPGSDTKHARRIDVRAHTHHHALGDEGWFQALTLSM